MADYTRFMADYWTINFNFEAIASLVSVSDNHFKVTGHFRTLGDFIGIKYSTYEDWNHDYVKYPYNADYTGTIFKFDVSTTGEVAGFDDTKQQPSLTVTHDDGSANYVTLGFCREKADESETFKYDGTIQLKHSWVSLTDFKVTYKTEDGTDTDATFGTDYDMDFVNGKVFTSDKGSIPYNAYCTITYKYNTGSHYTLDFDNLNQGLHPNQLSDIVVTNISNVFFPAIPVDYRSDAKVMTGESKLFTIDFDNIEVTGGTLGAVQAKKEVNRYSVAEGYDDDYYINPKRLVDSMEILGYAGTLDLYIGASHYYDKKGKSGITSIDETFMKVDPEKGINEAYKAWLIGLLEAMKGSSFDEIVISVSMENLQMPNDWKQMMWDGSEASSGWTPPTHFYDPNVLEVRDYIREISTEHLDIVVENGFKPILQLGEPWYWTQAFAPGDINIPNPDNPPAFYNPATVRRYESETKKAFPTYKKSDIPLTDENKDVAKALQGYMGEYSDFMKSIVEPYDGGQYTVLFFPPSVIGHEESFMSIVNFPKAHWESPKLDFFQIEDYDWVTTSNSLHDTVYDFPAKELGYGYDKVDYFTGFVLKHENADKEWKLIENAGQRSLGKNMRKTYVWAGTQIRRDSWVPELRTVIADAVPFEDTGRG